MNLLLCKLDCSKWLFIPPRQLSFCINVKLQNWQPHLHYQTVSRGRSCPLRHQSSTGCSGWGGSPRRWCSSGLEPAHWTPPCWGLSFWSHGGWRRWWKAWRDLRAKKLYPEKLVSQQSKSHLKVKMHKTPFWSWIKSCHLSLSKQKTE